MTVARYRCSTCNEVHKGFPDLAFWAPYFFEELTEAERTARGRLSEDLCTLDNKHFFIRAMLEIPILGTEDRFGWGIWVSLSETNFHRYVEFFETDRPDGEGPYFGWFSNRLPY